MGIGGCPILGPQVCVTRQGSSGLCGTWDQTQHLVQIRQGLYPLHRIPSPELAGPDETSSLLHIPGSQSPLQWNLLKSGDNL